MAEELHRDEDLPNTGTYPPEPLRMKRVRDSNPTLEQSARKVGKALGQAVVNLRDAREALHDMAGETRDVTATRITTLKDQARQAGARVSNIAEGARGAVVDKAREWREVATTRVKDLHRVTVEKASDVRSQVTSGYHRARRGANQTVHDYPLHSVLAAGLVGFVIGVGLRMWRSKREY